MIWFNGFPFLDNKEEHTFGVPVRQVMTREMTVLPTSGLLLKNVEDVLSDTKFQGFPIVEQKGSKSLAGYIGRTELRYAIDRAKRERSVPPGAKCHFTPPISAVTPSSAAPPITFDSMASTSGQMNIDFSRFIDPTPLAVHPQLPLETVMELFKKMGPRVILIEHRGKLIGLVTVKDCLKYQFKVEASENPREDSAVAESQERLWEIIRKISSWLSWRIQTMSGGRIKLGGNAFAVNGPNPLTRDSLTTSEDRGRIMDGTEEDDTGLELVDRAE